MHHLPWFGIRQPVEVLLVTAAVIWFCFSSIGIGIILRSFGLIDRVAGVATGAIIAALRPQILEWHGWMILWPVTGRLNTTCGQNTVTVVYNVLIWSGAYPSVRDYIHGPETLLRHVAGYIISQKLKSAKATHYAKKLITQTLCKTLCKVYAFSGSVP